MTDAEPAEASTDTSQLALLDVPLQPSQLRLAGMVDGLAMARLL